MLRTWTAAAVLACMLAAVGCGGSSTEAESSSALSPTQPTVSPQADAGARCEQVPTDLAQAILEGYEEGTGALEYVAAAAVRSKDFQQAHMIAIRFTAEGVGEQTGVWSSNSLENGRGLILAVDGPAKQFTVWPDADKTQAAMTSGDDGVAEAAACIHARR
jgi:hypothetical protein